MSIRVRLIIAMVLVGILPTALAILGASWMVRDLAAAGSHGTLELERVAALTGRRFAILLAIAFAISLVTGVVLSHRLTLALREVASAAARVIGGEWGAVHPLARSDEVGVLSRALSTMTGRMQSLVEGLEQHVAERTATLSAAAEVSRATTTVLDPDELVRQVVELVRCRFNLYYVGLFTLDDQQQYAVLRAGTGEAGQEMLARGHRLQVGGASMIGQCVAQSKARVALDVGEEAVRFENPLLPETRSELALPLRARGKVIGAMTVQSAQGAAFDESYIAVLQTMADQVSVAIDNARLFQQVEASLEAERRAYGQIARDAWQELFSARPNLAFSSDARGTLAFKAWEPQMKAAVRTGMMIGRESGTASNALALPIKVRDQVVGVIDARKPDGTVWTTDEIDLLMALTDQLSTALEGAQLYDATQRRASRERVTREITDRMRAALDWEELMQVAVQEIADALGASHAFVQWLEPQMLAGTPDRMDE